MWSWRSVEEEMSEGFSKDVLIEVEERSRSGHGLRRSSWDGQQEVKREGKETRWMSKAHSRFGRAHLLDRE